jgi:hypothetical protein
MIFIRRVLVTSIVAMSLFLSGCNQSQETIKIGWIDPLSGPFANVGENGLRSAEQNLRLSDWMEKQTPRIH